MTDPDVPLYLRSRVPQAPAQAEQKRADQDAPGAQQATQALD